MKRLTTIIRRIAVLSGGFRLFNILLFCLLSYTVIQMVQEFRSLEQGFDRVLQSEIASTSVNSNAPPVYQPLEAYQSVWSRKLFELAQEKTNSEENPEPTMIAMSPEDLGLKLIGTVVGGVPDMNLAIVEGLNAHNQVAYKEGDYIVNGEGWIKKIMRSSVVISKADQDILLAMEKGIPGNRPIVSESPIKSLALIDEEDASLFLDSLHLSRKEVAKKFANLNTVLQRVQKSADSSGGQTGEYLIRGLDSGSLLSEIGLREGDVIQGVNGERVTTPEQISNFIRMFEEGGDFSIQLVRKGTSKEVFLNIM